MNSYTDFAYVYDLFMDNVPYAEWAQRTDRLLREYDELIVPEGDEALASEAHKASLLIKSDKVDINHFTVSSVSKEVQQGDIISVRGVGRFILSDIGGLTRKDRLHIILRKYI